MFAELFQKDYGYGQVVLILRIILK